MLDQTGLLAANSREDTVEADVMVRTLRQWRKRTRIGIDLPAQAHDLWTPGVDRCTCREM